MTKLEFTKEEIEFLITVLGELPTKTGAFMLVQYIKNQFDAQVSKPEKSVIVQ